MQTLQFLFIDTNDFRCKEPTSIVERQIGLIYNQYDLDEDGLIQSTEFDKIMDELGVAGVDTPSLLT